MEKRNLHFPRWDAIKHCGSCCLHVRSITVVYGQCSGARELEGCRGKEEEGGEESPGCSKIHTSAATSFSLQQRYGVFSGSLFNEAAICECTCRHLLFVCFFLFMLQNWCESLMHCACLTAGPSVTMLRKTELLRGDREVLLDLDSCRDAQTTDGYGSLHNGAFIPPRLVSSILIPPLQYSSVLFWVWINFKIAAHSVCGHYMVITLPQPFAPESDSTCGRNLEGFLTYIKCLQS